MTIKRDPETSEVIADPLEPTREPIPAHLYGWGNETGLLLRDSQQIRFLPAGLRARGLSAPVAEGGAIFFERTEPINDESIPYGERWRSTGVYRLRFSDLSCERVPFEPRSRDGIREIGASPNGQRVVVTERWLANEVPLPSREAARDALSQEERETERREVTLAHWAAARTTFTVSDVGSDDVHELATVNGTTSSDSDSAGVQWSPDGTKIAASLLLYVPSFEPGGWPLTHQYVVRVWDVASGAELGTLKSGYSLSGSLSWSADSTRLLVEKFHTVRVLDITTGKVTPVPALPEQLPEPPGNGKHRLLGFTEDDRLFTVTHRGKAMTLWRMHPETGQSEPLARWSGSLDLYPVLGRMPADYWD